MPSLSHDLRTHDATNNACDAHAMLWRAADAVDSLVHALTFALGLEKLTTGEQAVIADALLHAGVDLETTCKPSPNPMPAPRID